MSKSLTSLIVFAGLVLLALLSVALVNHVVGDVRTPEILLTLVLILGVIALLVTMGALLSLLRSFGLASRNEALGLPPGSVRAILALMLVLVFAIMSIFLFYQSTRGGAASRGIAQEQVDLLPADRIVAIRAAAPAPDGTLRFDVDIAGSDASQQLAQQLITLLGTLVTAIAAFYFGSNSVTTALKGREGGPDSLLGSDSQTARAAASTAHALADTMAMRASRLDKLAEAMEATPADDPASMPPSRPKDFDL